MTHIKISNLEREVNDLRTEDNIIKRDVEYLKRELIDKTPERFGFKDLLRSFIGALFLGFSVLFSSNMLNVAKILPEKHLYVILAFALIILTAEIYFVGYARVENKYERKFGQFWLKRIIAFYAVSLIVAFILIYVFGLIYLIPKEYLWNAIILMSAPCAIGASFGDLIKKY